MISSPVLKSCPSCKASFTPHARLKDRQVCCGSEACKRAQKRISQKNWQARQAEDYKQAQRDWRKKNPDYWKNYRASHPASTQANREQSKIRYRLRSQTLQKRIDILQPLEIKVLPSTITPFAKLNRSLCSLMLAYGAGP